MKRRWLTLGFTLLLGWELLVLTFGFSLLLGGEALAIVPPAAWDVDQAPAKIAADARIAPSGEPGAPLVMVTQKMLADSSHLERFATVCSPQRDPEGAQRCTFNIRVRTQSNFP